MGPLLLNQSGRAQVAAVTNHGVERLCNIAAIYRSHPCSLSYFQLPSAVATLSEAF
jgi:hypothetical protein